MSVLSKRYAAFGGDVMLIRGGWGDFLGVFDTQQEAVSRVEASACEWGEVVDLLTQEVVSIYEHGEWAGAEHAIA
jgi:hypothetical protein